MQAISESTHRQYLDVLRRATGRVADTLASYAGVAYSYEGFPLGVRLRLRAALRRAWEEAGDEARGIAEAKRVQLPPRKPLTPQAPLTEADIVELEQAVRRTATPARSVLIEIMLRLGLRVTELLSLSRETVQAAVETGELVFIRKGGKEKYLPVGKAVALLERLLVLPRVMPNDVEENAREHQRRRAEPAAARWEYAREVVSLGTPQVAYNMVWRALERASRHTKRYFSPHWLRRAFATRMRADGADIYTIQKALGHERTETTQKYIRDDNTDVLKHMR